MQNSLMSMEATSETPAGTPGVQEMDQRVLMSRKPLHRFVQREPRSIGIVLLVFGCAELLMGVHLAGEIVQTSSHIYIPFWQGVLFLVCGILSIYTEVHPSKKMVTVCLSMYVVSLLGIIVSVSFRSFRLSLYGYHGLWQREDNWYQYRTSQLCGVEGILLTWSLLASVLLILLSHFARLALHSTHTQVIVQHIRPPQSEATCD